MLTTNGNLYKYGNNDNKYEEPSQIYQITRHATSCNNISMGKRIFLGKDSEPSLSVYGITKARELAIEQRRIGSKRFEAPSFPIAVSALIRTWETAVLLYGYGNIPTLQLRICPWLREASKWSYITDRGNEPKKLIESIPKFIKFLNKLRSNPTFGDNYHIRTITIYIPNIALKESNGVTLGSTRNDWVLLQIHYDQVDEEYKLPENLCTVNDTIYGVPVYQKEVGDIMKFMKWYESVFGYSPETVHTVAHSGIMQSFIKKHIDPDYKSPISEENCWSMTLPYHPSYNPNQKEKIKTDIKHGFPNPDKYDEQHNKDDPPKKKLLPEAKGMEENEGKASLCGDAGSVSPINCSSGGRRTRRKRSNRKKTRRYRRYSHHRR